MKLMRFCLGLLLVVSACQRVNSLSPPPLGELYFPSGVSHVAHGDAGILVVSNANFDKRFSSGSMVAIDLDTVSPPMPAFGGSMNAMGVVEVLTIETLNLTEESRVFISSFAGEMGALKLSDSKYQYFVPSRSEGMRLNAAQLDIIAGKPVLRCHLSLNAGSNDCSAVSPTLTPLVFEQSAEGVPRAVDPYGVDVKIKSCTTNSQCTSTCINGRCENSQGEPEAHVYVTHQKQADSPLGSQTNYRSYVVKLDSENLTVDRNSFIDLGAGPGSSVVAGSRFVYVSGRFNTNANTNGSVVRFIDSQSGLTYSSAIEDSVSVPDSRGLALSPDESRLYVATRSPNQLLTLGVNALSDGFVSLQPLRNVPLPSQPNAVRVLARKNQAPLVIITCTGANALVIYDDELGRVVAQVALGSQPFGLEVVYRGNGARMFVTNFADGRIAVVDMLNLSQPENAQVVAFLGARQTCLTQGVAAAGCGGTR